MDLRDGLRRCLLVILVAHAAAWTTASGGFSNLLVPPPRARFGLCKGVLAHESDIGAFRVTKWIAQHQK